MYKEYLELPFNFTIQAISGTDLNKVRRVFKELQRQLPPTLSSDFINIPCTLDLYETKLDKFEDDVCIQNMHGHKDSQFTIFVEFPETMLTIDQQRSFVKDHLSILKENLDVKKVKNVLMFIATKIVLERLKMIFYRFGEIPKNEKSSIWKGEEKIGEEPGVSVYEAHKNINGTYSPVLPFPISEKALNSFIINVAYSTSNKYLVTGDLLNETGTDGEPLIKNVKILMKL